jgi:hypothetical protein
MPHKGSQIASGYEDSNGKHKDWLIAWRMSHKGWQIASGYEDSNSEYMDG